MSTDPMLLIFIAGVLAGIGLAIFVPLTPDFVRALRSITSHLRHRRTQLPWK
jgi:hypothetical protein